MDQIETEDILKKMFYDKILPDEKKYMKCVNESKLSSATQLYYLWKFYELKKELEENKNDRDNEK